VNGDDIATTPPLESIGDFTRRLHNRSDALAVCYVCALGDAISEFSSDSIASHPTTGAWQASPSQM
jgi:hypothetical protein